MSRLQDQVEAYTKHGVVPVKWAAPDPLPNIPSPTDSIQRENARLKEALGVAACSLDCMSNLTSKNECHRATARAAIRSAMGA